MVSDDELARRIDSFEDGESLPADDLEARVDRLERDARDVHNELAERIERADRERVPADEFGTLLDRIDEIESRLERLEADR